VLLAIPLFFYSEGYVYGVDGYAMQT